MIKEALQLLGVSNKVTLRDIRKNYKRLLKEWHPDKCKGSKQECTEMTAKINGAYKVLLGYVENYIISFDNKSYENMEHKDSLWEEQFGNDLMWGRGEQY